MWTPKFRIIPRIIRNRVQQATVKNSNVVVGNQVAPVVPEFAQPVLVSVIVS